MHARPPRKRQQTAALAASPELSERGIATCVLGVRTAFDLLGPEGLKRKVDHEAATLGEKYRAPRQPRRVFAGTGIRPARWWFRSTTDALARRNLCTKSRVEDTRLERSSR